MNPADNTFLDEKAFAWILSLERRRSDRSRRSFLLLLLELHPQSQNRQRQSRILVKKIVQSLRICTRQTDIMGWYKNNVIIGVIYTELHHEALATDKIREKVNMALAAQLTLEQLNMLTISLHVYLNQINECSGVSVNDKLYPDLKQKKISRLSKRIIDILGSLSLLLLLSPVIIVVCILIKLTSMGPVLFKQTRIGQFRRPFTCLKFRSMYVNADSKVHEKYVTAFIRGGNDGDHVSLKQDGHFKISKDPRITPLGCILRKTSIDELPQLFNVLMGSMSLVGPRPPIPYEVDCYDTWHTRRILEASPGITGLWQVKGRSRTTFDDMVRLDLKYVDEWSVWFDIKILLQTPWAVFRCEGAR